MNIEEVYDASQVFFPQYTVTEVVDLGDECVVSVCGDDGLPPLQMPYSVFGKGEVSFYDLNENGARERLRKGKVVYRDYSLLKIRNLNKASANSDSNIEESDCAAAAVIVIKDGKILCASRRSSEGIGGPGGHIESGETAEDAALREAQEEFDIVPLNIIPLGVYKGGTGPYCDTMVYFTDLFTGNPKADGAEMLDERWLSIKELRGKSLFPPFAASLDMLENLLRKYLTISNSKDNVKLEGNNEDGRGRGNWGHKGRPGKRGGSAKGGGEESSELSPEGSGNGGFSDGSYAKAIKGTKTSDGKTVKRIRKHALDRAKERNIYPSSIKTTLEKAKPTPGNKPDRFVYEHNGTRAIYDDVKQELVTVIYVGKRGKK